MIESATLALKLPILFNHFTEDFIPLSIDGDFPNIFSIVCYRLANVTRTRHQAPAADGGLKIVAVKNGKKKSVAESEEAISRVDSFFIEFWTVISVGRVDIFRRNGTGNPRT